MMADEWIKVINILPMYLQYFIPGYLAIYLWRYCIGNRVSDNSAVVVKSIVISWMFVLPMSYLQSLWGIPDIIRNMLLATGAPVVSFVFFKLTRSKGFCKVLDSLGIHSKPFEDEFDILRSAYGGNAVELRVFVDEQRYYRGMLWQSEKHKSLDNYLILSDCITGKYGNDIDSCEQIESVIIYLSNVFRIEVMKKENSVNGGETNALQKQDICSL